MDKRQKLFLIPSISIIVLAHLAGHNIRSDREESLERIRRIKEYAIETDNSRLYVDSLALYQLNENIYQDRFIEAFASIGLANYAAYMAVMHSFKDEKEKTLHK